LLVMYPHELPPHSSSFICPHRSPNANYSFVGPC
jgi:hypothetical protein